MKPTIYIPIAPPASGKTTLLNKIGNMVIISGDNIREEFFGDADLQYTDEFLISRGYDPAGMTIREKEKTCHPIIWKIAQERTVATLKEGRNVGFDGVNSSVKFRADIIGLVAGLATVQALVIQADKETCMQRDMLRGRHAGEEAIDRHMNSLVLPELSEGFDIIDTYDKDLKFISRITKEDLQ